jgi:glycosyltransferase involved in cell wall biosynthesis
VPETVLMKKLKKKINILPFLLKKDSSHNSRFTACIIYYQYFGQLVHRESKALKDIGFDVDYIGLRSKKAEDIIQVYDGIKIFQIQDRPVAEKKALLYFFNLGLFFLKAFFIFTIMLPFKRYDFIHVTSPPDVMVFAAVFQKLFGAKILLDVHDIGPEFFRRKLHVAKDHFTVRLVKYLEKISCSFSDHVMTVSELWQNRLNNRSTSKEKCSVLINVPDESIFKQIDFTKFKIKKNTFDIFYHGSLEEQNGVDTLVKAMPLIRSQSDNIVLHLYCGKKGRLYEELFHTVQDHDMGGYVKFFDIIPFYKLPELLKNADLGVVPTKGFIFSDEILAMKSLEYIFLGIPIVISATKGHKFYFDQSMVEFFKPEDIEDLTKRILFIYRNAKRREEMVQNSRKFVKKESWINNNKNIYINIVQSIVKI